MNDAFWGADPVNGFPCPTEYRERYGCLYPSIRPEAGNGTGQPIRYPDIYYRIFPYAHRTCDLMDNPYLLYPSEAQVESMVDDCFDTCVRSMPDLISYADIKAEEAENVKGSQFFRRRPLLRDLIAIILIDELFRRRRGAFDYGGGYGYGPGIGPGYGY